MDYLNANAGGVQIAPEAAMNGGLAGWAQMQNFLQAQEQTLPRMHRMDDEEYAQQQMKTQSMAADMPVKASDRGLKLQQNQADSDLLNTGLPQKEAQEKLKASMAVEKIKQMNAAGDELVQISNELKDKPLNLLNGQDQYRWQGYKQRLAAHGIQVGDESDPASVQMIHTQAAAYQNNAPTLRQKAEKAMEIASKADENRTTQTIMAQNRRDMNDDTLRSHERIAGDANSAKTEVADIRAKAALAVQNAKDKAKTDSDAKDAKMEIVYTRAIAKARKAGEQPDEDDVQGLADIQAERVLEKNSAYKLAALDDSKAGKEIVKNMRKEEVDRQAALIRGTKGTTPSSAPSSPEAASVADAKTYSTSDLATSVGDDGEIRDTPGGKYRYDAKRKGWAKVK